MTGFYHSFSAQLAFVHALGLFEIIEERQKIQGETKGNGPF